MTLNKNVHEEPEYYLCPWCGKTFLVFHVVLNHKGSPYKDTGMMKVAYNNHYERCKKKFDEKQGVKNG